MKVHYLNKILFSVFTLLIGLNLVSCLDEGSETFPLEGGDLFEIVEGRWRIASSEIYDAENRQYVADMPDDELLYSVLSLTQDGFTLEQPGLHAEELDIYINDEDPQDVMINGVYYRIVSLGQEKMVVESYRYVNGEEYIHRYVFDRISGVERPESPVNDPEDIDRNEDENATSVVSTSESRTIVRGGYTLIVPKGAVPANSNGDDGHVAFSIQHTDDMPTALPSGVTAVQNGNVKIEPMGFTFSSPLEVKIPLEGFAPSDVTLYRYDEASRRWVVIPWSAINADGTATVSVLELGQFVLAKNAPSSTSSLGGIHINSRYIEPGYYYYLTLTPTGNTSGSSRSIAFTANGNDLYMAGIPKGTYNAVITREARVATQQEASAVQTYNEVLQVNVTNTLIAGNGGYATYSGWTELTLSSAGWNEGRPAAWGDETITYGTGKFQATLTWVNESGNTTDYDLHLTTPSGEVYYRNKREGSFELDRDVISELGNAVENIYSINDNFTPGNYKVRVHHYGGATGKRFNCRILVNGVVVKSVTGVQDSDYADIYSFTIE